MAVKSLGFFIDRLKISLRNDVCTLCQTIPRANEQEMICAACQKKVFLRQPLPLMTIGSSSIYAACEFPYRMKRLIYDLKFKQQTQHGLTLAEILLHYWQKTPPSKGNQYIVVPIPPHQNPRINHLPLMTRPFASHFGYNFMEKGLIWQRDVCPQHELHNKRKRRENVSEAFQIHPKLVERLQENTSILIMDDILTTGATLAEAILTFQRVNPKISVTALAASHVPFAISRR